MSRKRLAVARLWFEGNAFSPMPVGLAEFMNYEWQKGDAVLDAMRGTAHELGAVADFANAHPDWEVVMLRCAAAAPAGPIDEQVFASLVADLQQDLLDGKQNGGWDAVYLSLHGAAITSRRETPELDLARAVRMLLPGVPMGASFDLHGNLPPEWAQVLDFVSAYRTHPHVDLAETARRVLDVLRRCVESGLKTRRVLINERVILPSINMRTAAGPMAELEREARGLTVGAVLDVSVFGGFPYSDTAWTGASVFVTSDREQDPQGEQAADAARQITTRIHALAEQFRIRLPSAADAVSAALANSKPGLLAVTDSGDNPLSGGSADTPGLFRALLDIEPEVPCLFASFAQPDAVRAARAAGLGHEVDVFLGGRHGPQFGEGIRLQAIVEHVSDGFFRNTGPMQRGVERSCGFSVVLRVVRQPFIRVIVTERVAAADDPAFYAMNGLDLTVLRLICVKAKNHFRAAFADRCVEIIDCDAPGPACQDLSKLPFRHPHIPAEY
ncbi:M81 family peptidase [Allopusillimonas soli]|uniref:Microcystinase C n=1 Tax=Allopusillimonas soli TaxID=659016 RepID=A0A853F8N8_9BURK|nr:M81 family metallopeptidase [Allopusillimonas soli]NYT37024.1 M81 family metallopeptidase [Allopusillimonas soli]TEA75468.1 M81 family peptidase [Allopusillimonas soli]